MSGASESPKKRLRKDDDLYLIGSIDHQILGAKLPSNRQVLSVFFYNTRVAKLSAEDSAKLVAEEVSIFYSKARIPTAVPKNNKLKVLKLVNEFKDLQKNEHKKFKAHLDKEAAFVDKLDDLFDMSHNDSTNLIKDNVTRDFLTAQRAKGRVGCLLGVAEKENRTEHKRELRVQQEDARKAKAQKEAMKNGIFEK